MTRCNVSPCFCSDRPIRRIQSTGERYTLEEIEPGTYRYVTLQEESDK